MRRLSVEPRGGTFGRPVVVPADVLARIRRERAAGASLGAVARGLNADGVPTTPGGKQWYPSTIKALTSDARETVSEETT